MTCEEFLRALDRDEATGPEAAAHRASCPACERAIVRSQAIRRELRAWGEEPAPPFLHARIMANVRAAGATRARPWWALRPVWAGPALTLAILVTLGGYGLWRAVAPREEAFTAARQQAEPAPAAADPAPTLDGGPPDTAKPVAPMGQRPGRTAAERRARSAPSRVQEAPAAPPVAYAPEPEEQADRRQPRDDGWIDALPKPRDAAPREEAARSKVAAKAEAPSAADATAETSGGEADAEARKGMAGELAARSLRAAGAAARVECALTAPGGAIERVVRLSAASTPPAGRAWLLDVGPEGAVRAVRVEGGGAVSLQSLEELSALELAPGTWRLSRR